MMIFIIKNVSQSSGVWDGQTITAGGSYQLQSETERIRWVSNAQVLADIGNGTLVVNNGTNDLDAIAGWAWLNNNNLSVKVEENPPFAKPDYRTKRDGATAWIDLVESENKNSDYLMLDERYVSGGECIVIGAKKGDWISAEVVDANAVIPEAYRAALCEAWPTVAEYVVRANLVPFEGAKEYILNTYPLNAKITQGLVLRIKYHASAEVGTRSFTSNYYLTKKLL